MWVEKSYFFVIFPYILLDFYACRCQSVIAILLLYCCETGYPGVYTTAKIAYSPLKNIFFSKNLWGITYCVFSQKYFFLKIAGVSYYFLWSSKNILSLIF